ncbi:Protein kinase C-binding protein NELL2 [Nymphon striatum]|nr:Protein kinase C-binding protein NELL2 [Nymphon striatum]
MTSGSVCKSFAQDQKWSIVTKRGTPGRKNSCSSTWTSSAVPPVRCRLPNMWPISAAKGIYAESREFCAGARRGEVACRPLNCPAVYCKNPVTPPGECCPKCLRTCYIQQQRYEHGEQFSIMSNPCTVCTCQNGRMKCEPRDRNKVCPKLACPPRVQVQPAGECCKTCPDCSYGHDCHVNATCVSLNTRYTCLCKEGFTGSGKQCTDIDECETKGGLTGNHCQKNTRCMNTLGSYQCACLSGYTRKDAWNCVDENECVAGVHTCPENTMCVNDKGTYHCECAPGYKEDGVECKPICDPPCSPGGQCVAPNTCSCRHGYIGSNCDIDVDECAERTHHCDNNSACVNMPGWYYCECQKGYRRKIQRNSLIAQCQDIDECAEDSHTCLSPATCENTQGSYRCQCPNKRHRPSCSLGCFYEGQERQNGEVWDDRTNSCQQCKCKDGIVKCEHMPCNCRYSRNVTAMTRQSSCCPNCDNKSQCKHQETPQSFRNGQQWIYQCQVCECLHGEIDCWEMKCPPLNCENPVHLEGFCCPVCSDSGVCNVTANSTDALSNCMYQGKLYRHGAQMRLQGDACTSCECKIPYCDHLVSNMAINIHRMEILCVLLPLIVTLMALNEQQDTIQGILLLVLPLLASWGNSVLSIPLIAIKNIVPILVKTIKKHSLVSQQPTSKKKLLVVLVTNWINVAPPIEKIKKL